jgi:hypothetical protein
MADSVFLECQPIHLILKIKNLRMVKDSIEIIREEDNILLKDSTGKNLSPGVFVEYFGNPHSYFGPGQEKTSDYELNFEFANKPLISETKESGEKYQRFFYISSGKYSVVVKKRKIVSNELSFEVIKPEEQDLKELNELGIAYTKRDARYQIDKLYDFLIKFPDSKYYEQALTDYQSLLRVSGFTSDDYINLIIVADKWFKKDTESEFAKGSIKTLGSAYKTEFTEAKKKIKEYLNKIVTDYPGTIISRWSAEYIKLFKDE